MAIAINVSIFAHIELDSELNGRYGVQGNTFHNTFGYLNQYLKTLPDTSPKIESLTKGMEGLVAREKTIFNLRVNTVFYEFFEWLGTCLTLGAYIPQFIQSFMAKIYSVFCYLFVTTFDSFCSKTVTQINELKAEESLLLPGGWMGSPGHAMIYQFEKDAQGELIFSIYNSGSGINYHQQTSSIDKELFSPVKSYRLPQPIDQKQLKILIEKLIRPQLPLSDEDKVDDENKLYRSIERGLVFLDAEQQIVEFNHAYEVTGSQLSGTCSQRSIHQMLKLNFESLPEYQKFIFKFKMHALKDFINTHPAPRSKQITELIQKAVINNTKILQENNVFDNAQEKEKAFNELETISINLLAAEVLKESASWFCQVDLLAMVNAFLNRFVSNSLAQTIEAFDEADNDLVETKNIPLKNIDSTHISESLKAVISLCKLQQQTYPLWAINQIEHTLLQLPLPERFDIKDSYFESMDFYSNLSTAAEVETVIERLDELYEIYINASKSFLGEAIIPTQVITHCSFTALRSYLTSEHAKLSNTPSSHLYFQSSLSLYLKNFKKSTFLASTHPLHDKRLSNLYALTIPSSIRYLLTPFEEYQSIIDSEPELKKELEAIHQKSWYKIFDDKKANALYAALSSFDEANKLKPTSALNAQKFMPLVIKLRKRFILEQAYQRYLEPPLDTQDSKSFYDGSCSHSFSGGWFEFSKVSTINHLNSYIKQKYIRYQYSIRLKEQQNINHHKYDCSLSPAQNALYSSALLTLEYYNASHFTPYQQEMTKRGEQKYSNEIQLQPYHSVLNNQMDCSEYFYRDLLHLRRDPKHQIKLTLEYFSRLRSMLLLSERSNQQYVEANIFEPLLLLEELKHNEGFIEQFNAFTEKGLSVFKAADGLLSQGSLFFIKLRIDMHRYVAINEGKDEFILSYQEDTKQLTQLINGLTDPNIITTLHTLRFYHAMTLHQLFNKEEPALVEQAIISYFHYKSNSNPHLKEDTASRFEMSRVSMHFKDCIVQLDEKILEKIISKITTKLTISIEGLILDINSPRLVYKNVDNESVYSINLEQGKIYHKNYALSVLPLNIKNHPAMQLFDIGGLSSCWMSEDENIILLKQANVRLKRKGKELIIQKQWSLESGESSWYELRLLNDKQRKFYSLEDSPLLKHKLPEILQDKSIQAWSNSEETLLIKNHKPIYQIDKSGYVHQLNDKGEKNGCLLSSLSNAQNRLLTKFESLDFIEVNQAHNHDGTVDFSRYGLRLQMVNHKLFLAETNYELVDESFLDKKVASLTFREGEDKLCIIPVQKFYVEHSNKKVSGEYYPLTHDTTEHISTTVRCKELNIKEKSQLPLDNHHDAQIALSFEIDQDNALKPQCAGDALYLIYCYLATNETDRALKLLHRINIDFAMQGTTSELTFISWIINDLPIILDKKAEELCTLETPEYISCQLQALALYAEHCNFMGNQISDAIEKAQDLKAFKSGLFDTIESIYSSYLRMKRHLNEDYLLPDDSGLALFHFMHQKEQDSTLKGALGYENRRLILKSIMIEFQQLEALSKSLDEIPTQITSRFNELKAEIESQKRVMKKSTQLEKTEIDLSLSTAMKISYLGSNSARDYVEIPSIFNDSFLTPIEKEVIIRWQNVGVFYPSLNMTASIALERLNSEISASDFINGFSTYLTIAESGTKQEKKLLETFCKHYLMGFVQTGATESGRKIHFLAKLLYRMLNAPYSLYSSHSMTLSTLIKKASKLPVSPLFKEQSIAVLDDLLITSQEIWHSLKTQHTAPQTMPALKALYPAPVWQLLGMSQLCEKYDQIEKSYLHNMTLIDSEDEAGTEKFNCLTSQRQIADDIFSQDSVLSTLKNKAEDFEKAQQAELTSLWQSITDLIDKNPKDKIKLLAKQTHHLTKSELLKLYLDSNLTQILNETSLDENDSLALYQLLHGYVSLSVQHQQVQRILAAIKQSDRQLIAKMLMSENHLEAQKNPALLLFQYQENILVRLRQMEALASLLATSDNALQYNNVVEKVIMGGGKSKVILPLIAAKKATGLNLVIIEVPRPLLDTNHNDLNATSQKHFNQRAHKFEFNRDSDCSARHLKNLFQTFTQISINKDYLVTTGESMQSLELKYLDLLLTGPISEKDNNHWQQQVFWLSQIVGLIKNRGDVIIDEVHQGLLLKKKLNYTIGANTAISQKLVNQSIALYDFIDVLKEDNQVFSIEALLHSKSSPLRPLIQQLIDDNKNKDINKILSDYFNDHALDNSISNAPPELKDHLAFYKEQLTLLPLTQARHFKEHYGPSEVQSTALSRALAIPYFASNQPNERSRFGNTLETLNYSIQSLLSEGLNAQLLKESIREWQKQANQELNASLTVSLTFNETAKAKRINQLLNGSGFNLSSINLQADNCDQVIAELLSQVMFNRKLIFEILKDKVLPQIMLEPSVLHSDSYNHVGLYRSVQGVSGTPDNHDYYHQKLHYNPKTSMGTDGYIKTILKNKKTSVTQVLLTSSDEFIKKLFEMNVGAKALIDVSATFAGIKNIDVVFQILSNLKLLENKVKFILYFNESDTLCALDTKSKKIIKLNSSDPDVINKKLKCTPESRFTYYDQSHTVGTDLKQSAGAHALVLADHRTQSQAFLQGVMRMRGLEEAQSVSIIVPENTAETLEDLFILMDDNQQRQLKQDCFFAALAKMDNVIRQDFLSQIAKVPHADADRKRLLSLNFKHYFLETKPASLFEECGGIKIEQNIGELLNKLEAKLMLDWRDCLKSADITFDVKEGNKLKKELSSIVTNSIPLCDETIKSKSLKDQPLGMAVEHEQETMKENEKEVLNEAVSFQACLKAEFKGDLFSYSFLKDNKGIDTFINHLSYRLNDKTNQQSFFSDRLSVSKDYGCVYTGQEKMVGPYLKPVMAILFFEQAGYLHACLIDQEDLVSASKYFEEELAKYYWISTPEHRVLEGVMPDNILENKDYLSFIEQIKFFNGDLGALTTQNTPIVWLNDKTEEKLAYFINELMPYRQTTQSEFNALKTHLQNGVSPTISAGFFHHKQEDAAQEAAPSNLKVGRW